ncbi:unnamed protein product [Effrenium voratum]|nr:unnamed protein product [Effrenium voratum]
MAPEGSLWGSFSGINERDNEEEIGDFFSQWGLVALVYRDKANWGFIHFATKEGASRVLEEERVLFQRRPLDVKKATDRRSMSEEERDDLVRRAVARPDVRRARASQRRKPKQL